MKLLDKVKRTLGLLKDYGSVFDTPEGEIVLYDLMKQGCVLRPTHVPGDKSASDKNEGKRELVLYIMYMLNVDPQKFLEQVRRHKQEDVANENYFKEPI